MRSKRRWLVGILAISLVASVLIDLQGDFGLMLRAPWPGLRRYFLPLLVVLAALLCLLVGRLLQLAKTRSASRTFDDMEAAWNEAMRFLRASGVDFRGTPVFLVIGSARDSAILAGELTRIPLSHHAELSFYVLGQGDALFVNYLADSTLHSDTMPRTSGHGTEHVTIDDILAQEHEPSWAEPLPDAFAHQQWLRRTGLRLRHLCRLLVEEREPYCPVNGILLLAPLAAAETEHATERTTLELRQELATARRSLRVDCPVHVLACGLEGVAGAGEFLAALSPPRKQQSLGLRLPLLPDLDPHENAAIHEKGVHWVCNCLLPRTVYRLMRGEGAANAALTRFLADMHERSRRLARIVAQGTDLTDGGTVMLAGFHLAAGGDSPAFVAGVLRDLLSDQNYVSWTPETVGRDMRLQRVAGFGYVTLVSLVAFLLSLGYIRWRS